MTYLKIDNDKVYYLNPENEWKEIDSINKDDLMYLLDKVISDDDFTMDEFNEENINNKAHQIIYKNIHEKLTNLLGNKTRFRDESRQLYKDAIDKYKVLN